MKVLDKGFLELDAVYGSEADIVSAARVCTSTECTDKERNDRLLRYLITNGHTSPLEMMQFRFRVKCPIFVARQWMRHRTWSYNEASQRYKKSPCEFYIPKGPVIVDDGTGLMAVNPFIFIESLMEHYISSTRLYEYLVASGVDLEQARIVLPLATYTEFVCQVDLNNLLKFLEQRLHPRAQWEIRQYATAIAEHVRVEAPTVWRAFIGLHPKIDVPGHQMD